MISVIIPVKGLRDITKHCLDSLKTYTSDYELVLIDDGSKDEEDKKFLIEAGKDHLAMLIRHEESKGWCRSINEGIEHTSRDFVVFSNNDVVFTPDWAIKMISWFNRDPKLGVLGPVTNFVEGKQFFGGFKGAQNLFYTDALTFFCVMIRREVIDQIGGLDERFDPGGQDDSDYCIRVDQAGWKVGIASDVFIHHIGSATFRKEFEHDAPKSRVFSKSRKEILKEKYTMTEQEKGSDIVWRKDPRAAGSRSRSGSEIDWPAAPRRNMKSRSRSNSRGDKGIENFGKRKVFFGIPSQDSFMATGLNMDLVYWSHDQEVITNMNGGQYIWNNVCPLDNARNTIVKEFLETDFDYLWHIDDDIVPPPEAMQNLLSILESRQDIDMIGATIFFMKHWQGQYFPLPTSLRYNRDNKYEIYHGSGIDWVDATSSACLMVRRKVFESIEHPYQYMYHRDGTLKLTADYRFCQKAQEAGFKIFMDYTLHCDHIRICSIKGVNDLLVNLQTQAHGRF